MTQPVIPLTFILTTVGEGGVTPTPLDQNTENIVRLCSVFYLHFPYYVRIVRRSSPMSVGLHGFTTGQNRILEVMTLGDLSEEKGQNGEYPISFQERTSSRGPRFLCLG